MNSAGNGSNRVGWRWGETEVALGWGAAGVVSRGSNKGKGYEGK